MPRGRQLGREFGLVIDPGRATLNISPDADPHRIEPRNPMLLRWFSGLVALLFVSSAVRAAGVDGRLFDQGTQMTAPAASASAETARLAFLRGAWDVRTTHYAEGIETRTTTAQASTTLMNRGHGYLERYRCEDFDGQGHARHTVSFVVHSASTGSWNLGLADSWSESITLYSGGFDGGDEWTVETIDRRGGSGPLVHRRLRLRAEGADAFALMAEEGPYEAQLKPIWTRSYTRRAAVDASMTGQGDGEPADGLVQEARQFDFLLGQWDLQHEMTFPNGQVAKWPAEATAVRMLGGHAIMEHSWYDVDPNLPDAATTILRVYNRAMRRWESMYSTNRSNNILHFGGVMEGDRIVLHGFASDTARAPFSYWTFHDMTADGYGWYADTSKDRGQTFQKTWIIAARRRGQSR
jgi:hypothetical protein